MDTGTVPSINAFSKEMDMKAFIRLIAILVIAATLGACATYGTRPTQLMEKEKQSHAWPAQDYPSD